MKKKNKNNNLKVGDTVMYRGSFGRDDPIKAVITSIELTRGSKYGDSFKKIPWNVVTDRNVVVDLDNGHWAYGEQISCL